jgi:hypothetical protein
VSKFFATYWKWFVGAAGLLIVVRQWKVATDESILNAATSTEVPYAHAGGVTTQPSQSGSSSNTSGSSPSGSPAGGPSTVVTSSPSLSGAQHFVQPTLVIPQVTLPPPTETGINRGSENGSLAVNAIMRNATVVSGQTNSYQYINPVTGAYSTQYIHTAYSLDASALFDGSGDDAPPPPILLYDPNPNNDTTTPLVLGDRGAQDLSGYGRLMWDQQAYGSWVTNVSTAAIF